MNEHREGPADADEEALLRRWYAASFQSRPIPSDELLARDQRPRGRRPTVPNLAAAVVVVAVVAGIAGVGAWAQFRAASGPSAPRPVATASGAGSLAPSLRPSPSARPSASGPLPGDLPAPVTFSGSSAWMLLDSGVSLSNDGGRTWTTVAFPSGVASSKVAAVATAPGRPLWLAVGSGGGYRLYRQPNTGSAWSSVLLTPSWGSLPGANGPADMVKVTPGPGSVVSVAETMSGGMTSAVTSLFVSSDDGKSFVQHPPRSGSGATTMYWASITFSSAARALLINGPDTYPHDFFYTTDGGATWSVSTVTGLPEAPNYQPDPPLLMGSDILVPVTICGADCGTTTYLLLVSHDGGATLNPMGAPIPSGGNAYRAVATLGSTVWVVVGDAFVESSDGGKTWTAVSATGLPVGAVSIALTGPNSATVVIGESGCNGFKTDCWSSRYLVATTDGGRTWTHL